MAACGRPAPPPVTITVAPSSDTLVVPVVDAGAVVARPDGWYVVLGPIENKLFVADFSAHTVTPYPGITPADVPHPVTLFGVGDSIVVGDWGLKRFTEWTPVGQRLAAWPAPDALQGALPRARDAAGQWYFQVMPNPKDDGSGLLDSGVVVRADPQLTRFDTLAKLAPGELVKVGGVSGARYQRRTMGGDDAWGVEPDGTLWLARVFQNRIEWRRPGSKKVERSKMFPDMVLTMSEMDRELFVRRFPEDQQETARELPNAPVKPPFEHVFVAANNRMWLAKSDTALAPVRHLQVVDKDGVLFNIYVPSRGQLRAVDANYLLMAEEFPGGIRLIRYPVPPQVNAAPTP